MGHRLRAKLRSSPLRGSKLKRYINQELVQNGLGIWDASDKEVQRVVDNIETAGYVFSDMISRRAQVGWTTHGHSAVDVNIYGTAGSSTLRGNHENTDIGKFLRNYLGVKVGDITDKLGEAKTFKVADEREISWTGRIPSEQDIRSALRYDEQRHDNF
jgi:alkaline phosphatase